MRLQQGGIVRVLLVCAALLTVQELFGLAQQAAVRHTIGQSSLTVVPKVSESWNATLGRTKTKNQKQVRFIGHFPGYSTLKAAANQHILRPTTSLKQSLPATASPLVAEAPGTSAAVFAGPSESDTPYIPPDSQVASGPNYVVVVINSLIAIYDKTGAQQGSYQQLSSFFSSLGVTGEIYDPRIIYDQVDNRFILTVADVDQVSFTAGHVLLAVSQTSDPTGIWNKYAVNFMGRNPSNTSNTFPDFPTLGLSSSAVYISTGQFVLNAACMANDTCSFSDTWVSVIGLSAVLAGSSTLNITTFKNVTTASGYPAFTIQPAVTYGAASGEFLVGASFIANPGTTLNVFEINTSGTPALSTADLTVPQFLIPPDAAQPGVVPMIATNDFRLLNAVWSNNSLWTGQNVQQSSGQGAAARWYQIAATSLSTLSMTQTGDVTASGNAYFPSLGIKPNGDVGVVFTTSSNTQFASAAFTGRSSTDPPGTMRGVSIYQAGTDDYVDFATRWGDYSGISPDPSGGSFWMIAEYAGSPDPHFGTAIAQAGSPPELSLSSTELDFGSETVNVTSAPKSVTVTNSAAASLTLGTVVLGGPDPADFAISSDGCSNVTLAAGQSCALSVTFTPANIETESAVLLININPAGLPEQVYLTGQGAAPTAGLTVSPTTVTFPDTPAHTVSAPQAVEVTNTSAGSEDLEINLQGNEPFTENNNCGTSLAPGKTCNINVTFRPSVAGTFSIYLNIAYPGFPAGVSVPSVYISGTAITAPGTTFCPSSLSFGNQTVGTASSPQSVTLNNSGTSDLTVNAIGISGDFSQTSNCGTLPATIPPYSSCSISVVFNPTAAGTQTGTLTVTDTASGSPQAVQLTGTGVTSTASAFPLSHILDESGNGGQGAARLPLTLHPPASAAERSAKLAAARYGRLPLSFEANHGQTSPEVKFLSRGADYTLFLASRESVLEVRGTRQAIRHQQPKSHLRGNTLPSQAVADAVRMVLVGANANTRILGLGKLPGKVNYLIGNDPSKWKTNVPLYAKVKYQNVYPGTDLIYYGNSHQLEYDFVVAQGGDPKAIRFMIISLPSDAAEKSTGPPLRIVRNGDLVINTAAGEVRFRKPVVYQMKETGSQAAPNRKLYLQGRFALRKVPHTGYEVAFRLASYDHSRPLVIDPVLSYSTYLGGSATDEANAIAVDASGSAYVTGTTASANFPVANPLQSKINRTFPSDTDTFITKLSPDGSSMVFSTFLGGSRGEVGSSIAVDSQGNAYVGGETKSSDFPVTKGAFQTVSKGGLYGADGFLAKIDPTGSTLIYSTYFGGSSDDMITGVALDAADDAYITGVTASPDLPVTSGALQSSFGGSAPADCFQDNGPTWSCGDAFAAEMNPQGTGLVYSTYLGGTQNDYASGIAVDSTGSAYVTGITNSLDFPTTPGAFQTWFPPSFNNAFIAKIKPQGSGLAYSTYLGPKSGYTTYGAMASGIAVDAQGDAYVAGTTDSSNFPTVNPIQTGRPVYPSAEQAFVAKLHPAGCGLVYSTRLGGFLFTSGSGIAVDSGGDAYVTGWTVDFDFPVLNPFEASYRQTPSGGNLRQQAFVTELAPTGSSLIYSSYLGGTTTNLPTGYGGGDLGDAIAVDSAGNAYIAGKTDSIDFPVVNGVDSAPGGERDGFVSKVAPTVVPSITLGPSSLTFPDTAIGTTSSPLSVTMTNTTSAPVTISGVAPQPGNPHFAVASNSCDTTVQPGASCTFSLTFSPAYNLLDWSWVTVNDNAFAGPHTVPVYGTGYTPATIKIYGNQGNSELDSTPVGTKATSAIQVENTGSQQLTISGVSVTGSGFSQTNDCTSIPPLGQCTVTLTFTPAAAGSQAGTLTVTGNASNSPQSLPLTGIGQDFSMAAAPGTASSATVTAGQSATYTIDIGSPSGFNQPISLACSGAPTQATCSIDQTTIVIYGTTPETAKLTVSTASRSLLLGGHRTDGPRGFGARDREFPVSLVPLIIMMLALLASVRLKTASGRAGRAWIGFSTVVLLLLLWVSCGGGGGGGGGSSTLPHGTPAGTYTLTVTGTSGSISHNTTLTLTVK